MSNLNVVAITGRLTRDPELRSLPSGTSVCEMGIAINSRVKKNDEWVDHADFVDVTVWANQAENCAKYLAKGRQVAIKGRLRLERWETDGGEKRSKLSVVADMVEFIGGRDDDGGSQSAAADPGPPQDKPVDDIPF